MTKPPGWAEVALQDVATSALGKMLDRGKARGVQRPYLRNQNVRWDSFDLSDVFEMPFDEDEFERFGLRAGDLLICEGGEPGRAAVWDGATQDMKFQKALHRVRPGEALDARYLLHRLRLDASTGGLSNYFTGTTIKHLTGVSLGRYRFLLPPINEQRRIVAKLDAIFEQTRRAKSRLERLPALLDKLKRSILTAAFRGDLTTDWRAAHPDVEQASTLLDRIRAERRARFAEKGASKAAADFSPDNVNRLPSLPPTWTWAGLSEVAELQLGQRRAPEYRGEDEYKYVRAANITWRGLDLSDVKTMGFVDTERLFLRPGDVLLNEASGSPTEVGKPALWRGEIENCCFQATVLRLRPDSTAVLPEWLYFSNLADALLGRIAAMAPGIGILHLTAERMRRWPVPVPPLEEQQVLVKVLSDALARVYAMEDRANAFGRIVDNLERSAMAKAFRGELVEQDPTDEPAASLLDRLRAEATNSATTASAKPIRGARTSSRPTRGRARAATARAEGEP